MLQSHDQVFDCGCQFDLAHFVDESIELGDFTEICTLYLVKTLVDLDEGAWIGFLSNFG